ncbi:MAG TPA: manganese efflux pump MntP family protein [Caldisericia bacterium]|nr:manganese efflux pump MntP family protein [Caldisericia bacterium]HPF49112.1 manganese efflux pump MntP family protein [Caldisericia bacterium]HPI83024.1 manganese efflux pump MntP family protein [Caldisericia bacterium]HPQ92251.1 manganese efflux pump MntP family protein [Caldisericia bacterium]HRV74651.1 manganese efflux pump MntP family protein [Caldisericia bacterium]
MNLITIIGIAFGLAMDATAVSIASGIYIKESPIPKALKMAFFFGLFQGAMPILGWFAGNTFAGYIDVWDHWVAFVLLAFIGGKMLYESFDNKDKITQDPSKGWLLITLAIATSIDALAVGLSFSMLGENIWIPSLTITVITFVLSVLGVLFGSKLGAKWTKGATFAGGLILIAIGVRIVITHLIA